MNPMRVLVVVSSLWIASELVLLFARRSRSETATGRDQGSIWVLWVVFTGCAFLASMLSSVRETRFPAAWQPYAIWIGIVLIVTGCAIRVAAILTLRSYFTVDVAIANDHKVINTGLYAVVRHPSYLGSFLSFLGLGLALRNWISVAIIVAGAAMAIAYRIRIEERALIGALGDAYRSYAARTKRFIPGLY